MPASGKRGGWCQACLAPPSVERLDSYPAVMLPQEGKPFTVAGSKP
jgi:hypothetical protein